MILEAVIFCLLLTSVGYVFYNLISGPFITVYCLFKNPQSFSLKLFLLLFFFPAAGIGLSAFVNRSKKQEESKPKEWYVWSRMVKFNRIYIFILAIAGLIGFIYLNSFFIPEHLNSPQNSFFDFFLEIFTVFVFSITLVFFATIYLICLFSAWFFLISLPEKQCEKYAIAAKKGRINYVYKKNS